MNQSITLSKEEWKELTGDDIQEAIRQIKMQEQTRCIALIREHCSVYIPGYRLDKLIEAIESGR